MKSNKKSLGLKLLFQWAHYVIKWSLGRRRFLAILPPFFSKQILFDRLNKSFFKIIIRDDDDWIQLEHIFLNEEFNLVGTGRLLNIENFYKDVLRNKNVPLILDIGSNIGLASKYFNCIYPFAKIVAVEPDDGNFEIAVMNLESNARMICAGISSKIGSARLMDMGRNCAFRVSSEDPNSYKGVTIDLITIPDILLEEQVNIPFLIKIDIEGFESDLFSQATEWIDRFPVLLIELHDWMLPGEMVTNNFLKEISKRNREFMHFDGYVVSISPELINSKIK